jgi:hypothetical protein
MCVSQLVHRNMASNWQWPAEENRNNSLKLEEKKNIADWLKKLLLMNY